MEWGRRELREDEGRRVSADLRKKEGAIRRMEFGGGEVECLVFVMATEPGNATRAPEENSGCTKKCIGITTDQYTRTKGKHISDRGWSEYMCFCWNEELDRCSVSRHLSTRTQC